MRLAILALMVGGLAACDTDDTVQIDGTLRSDGYALFAVDNPRQQRANVALTVNDADPGSTYVLLYSVSAPTNAGWFAFDPSTKSRCGGDTGAHCEVPGYGFLVDVVKVADGATSVTLRDDRCGCDADRDDRDWTGHWAVMRVERTDRTNRLTFHVEPKKISHYTDEPDVTQLQ